MDYKLIFFFMVGTVMLNYMIFTVWDIREYSGIKWRFEIYRVAPFMALVFPIWWVTAAIIVVVLIIVFIILFFENIIYKIRKKVRKSKKGHLPK